jgi:formylglycine-generating enzyme required for sulfatase activity
MIFEDVFVDLSGTYIISVDADVTISTLTMGTGTSTLMLNTGTFMIATSDMVLAANCFQMGDTFAEGYPDELPPHLVCLNSFAIDTHEVTQKAYQTAMGTNPSSFSGDNLPVEQVTWSEAGSYCQSVGKRLPTEAEWEYAARSGGQSQRYAGTSDLGILPNYAWYWDNSGLTSHLVGQKLANALGLYDLSGNVAEWVSDLYDSAYYDGSPQNNPQGPASNLYGFRVYRGGSWDHGAPFARASIRNSSNPDWRFYYLGFRCARTN